MNRINTVAATAALVIAVAVNLARADSPADNKGSNPASRKCEGL